METRKGGNGLETFLEHWGMVLPVLVIFVLAPVLLFFMNLSGMPWIYFFIASEILLFSGAGLILYAKLPVYRSGRFFTFGVKIIPPEFAGFYKWGWRVFLLGVILSLCLLLSRR